MKFIELTQENEVVVAQLCDLALKSAGLQAHDVVQKLKSLIQEKELAAVESV